MQKLNILAFLIILITILSNAVYATITVTRSISKECVGDRTIYLAVNLNTEDSYFIDDTPPVQIISAGDMIVNLPKVSKYIFSGAQSTTHYYGVRISSTGQVTFNNGQFTGEGIELPQPIPTSIFNIRENICTVDSDGDRYALGTATNNCNCIGNNDCLDNPANDAATFAALTAEQKTAWRAYFSNDERIAYHVHPGWSEPEELCGNNIDEDCSGADRICPGGLTRSFPNGNDVLAGSTIDVKLKIAITDQAREKYYAIDEAIPPGFEVTNKGLFTESTINGKIHLRYAYSPANPPPPLGYTTFTYTLRENSGIPGIRDYNGDETKLPKYRIAGSTLKTIEGSSKINVIGGNYDCCLNYCECLGAVQLFNEQGAASCLREVNNTLQCSVTGVVTLLDVECISTRADSNGNPGACLDEVYATTAYKQCMLP